MRRRRLYQLLCTASLLLVAACARAVAVESEPGPVYTLAVHNNMSHAMIVSYDDGGGATLLGTVAANGDGQFIITNPARTAITVTATNEGRTHRVDRQVTLRAGATVTVTI